MFTDYELSNFKAFSGCQQIPIRPITLIYGQNSSGKSSILQSLLLLKQTLEGAENPSTLLLPKGSLVDLGGYREFINSHDVAKPFSFRVTLPLTNGRECYLPQPISKAISAIGAKSLGVKITFGFDNIAGAAKLDSLDLFIGDYSEPALCYITEQREQKSHFPDNMSVMFSTPRSGVGDNVFKIKHLNKDHPFWKALWVMLKDMFGKDILPSAQKKFDLLKHRIEQYRVDGATEVDETRKTVRERRLEKDLSELERIINRFSNYTLLEATKDFDKANQQSVLFCKNYLPVGLGYVGNRINIPFSQHFELLPAYRYAFDHLPGIVLRACTLLEESLEKMVYIGPLRNYPERHYIFSGNLTEQVGKSGKMVPDVLFKNESLKEKVNQQLKNFGLGYELKVSSVIDTASDLQDVFALRLYDQSTKVHSSILDVGFGISQVLPIIVQSMLSNNRTLLIEQPEIHLHPKLQADLGSLFAECSQAPYNNQFLIETHSQHIILRLQRLIRQGRLDAKSVSVVYVNRTESGSVCIPLRIDRDGDFIDEWPNGFFEEGYNELF